jgi:hypothetical protein
MHFTTVGTTDLFLVEPRLSTSTSTRREGGKNKARRRRLQQCQMAVGGTVREGHSPKQKKNRTGAPNDGKEELNSPAGRISHNWCPQRVARRVSSKLRIQRGTTRVKEPCRKDPLYSNIHLFAGLLARS